MAQNDNGPLIANLQQILSADELLVTFLLDSSGSVGSQYPVLKSLCGNLATKLKGVEIQVLQFSATARTECSFNKDPDIVSKAINNMTHMNGSTNMADGFRLTRTSLLSCCSETSTPVVFFITDGDPTGENPIPEVQKLLQLKPAPQIIGIAVGTHGTVVDKLRRILSGQQVYSMNDYSMLDNVIKSLTVKPSVAAEPPIRISFSPANTSLQKSRSNLTLKVTCEPDITIPALPAGTEITFIASEFFFANKIKLETAATQENPFVGQVTLKLKPNALYLGTYPAKIWWEASIPSTARGKYKGYVHMQLGWLAGDFIYDEDPSQECNILVWGAMGAGKSSLINGACTAFASDQKVKRPLTAYRSDKHVTRMYSKNSLAELIASVDDQTPLSQAIKDNLKINFWDPWGLTLNGFKQLNILHFLEGRVYPNTQLHDNACTTSADDRNKIDAVILIIPIGTSQDQPMLEMLQWNIKAILDSNIYPVIVVNFINTVKSEEEIKKAKEIIRQASCLNERDIIMLDNYENEEYRNMDKDLMYWNLLTKIYTEAKKSMLRRRKGTANNVPDVSNLKVFQGSAPASPMKNSAISNNNASTGKKVCKTASCSNKGNEVTFPRCGFCGQIPELDVPPVKVCGYSACSHFSKEVQFPFCPQCGKPPVDSLPTVRRCTNNYCSNNGKPVDYPVCPYCGTEPSYK